MPKIQENTAIGYLYVYIPTGIRRALNLKRGDDVEIEIKLKKRKKED